MSDYLSPKEKAEIAKQQSEIDAVYYKSRAFQAMLENASTESGAIIASLPDKLKECAQSENPLATWREVRKLKNEAEELAMFADDMAFMPQQMLLEAKPAQQRATMIDKAATQRRREIMRLQEQRDSHHGYGINKDEDRELALMLAAQAG